MAHLALVGKGITFDSGGLTIKPGAGMDDDEVRHGRRRRGRRRRRFAIAELGLPVRVTTFAPMAENMVSGTSMRPGDVLTMYGGTTVEVLNTDAEGRLVLADALVLAAEQKPDVIVDVATLTGAMRRSRSATGSPACSATTTSVDAGHRGRRASRRDALADADPAGDASSGSHQQQDRRPGPARLDRAGAARCTPRRSCSEFVGERPWAHLDIAGPAFNTGGAVRPRHRRRHRLRGVHPGRATPADARDLSRGSAG